MTESEEEAQALGRRLDVEHDRREILRDVFEPALPSDDFREAVAEREAAAAGDELEGERKLLKEDLAELRALCEVVQKARTPSRITEGAAGALEVLQPLRDRLASILGIVGDGGPRRAAL